MSSAVEALREPALARPRRSTTLAPRRLAIGGLAFAVASAAAVIAAPLAASMASVVALAGPHLWCESRVFLSLLPPRWSTLRRPLLTGLVGALLLAVSLPLITALQHWPAWPARFSPVAASAWLTALWLWLAFLVSSRGRERRRDREWAWPLAFLLVSAAWIWPAHSLLALVYLHPLVALAFLWRIARRRRPHWLPGLRVALGAAAMTLAMTWLVLARAPDVLTDDALAWRIASHAGAFILPGVSSHLLVATHVYLEMLHYAAWMLLIPLAILRSPAWTLTDIPLARASSRGRLAVGAWLSASALMVVMLWTAFSLDPATTRDVYFTLALVHVLAEAPFLVRLT